ncbi:MAG: hypothetical protein APR63_10750 [Desulfuromonas sp. SDB]|nr:MAG: hypothetical protein APR63_10750 [Desulfuromonas sp. SDB]
MQIAAVGGITFALSLIVVLYSTPIARKAAIYFKILDFPDGKLKNQKQAVPYLGGISIYAAVLISSASLLRFDTDILGILLSGSILMLVGILDDLKALTPIIKLGGQIFACFVIVKADIFIDVVSLPWWINFPLTILWVLTIINTFNIIDVMDGLCITVTFFSSLFIAALAFLAGQNILGMLALSLCAAAFGFFWFNKPPAKIYLGDAGSMLVGLFIAAMAMSVRYTYHSNLGLIAPVVVLGVPIFELVLVVIIRTLNKKPFYLGSPDHFSLRLKKLGINNWWILFIVSLVSILLGIGSIIIVLGSATTGIVTAGLIVVMMLIAGVLLSMVKV